MILFEPSFLALPVTAIRAATDLAVIPETKFTTSVIGVSDILSSALIIGGIVGGLYSFASLFLGGLPILISLIISSVSEGYTAWRVMGFMPALCMRASTVLKGKPKASHISLIVKPSMTYMSALSGTLGGLPLLGTLLMASSAVLSYSASLVMGFILATKRRCITVLGAIPRICAISLMVRPSIYNISEIIREKLNFFKNFSEKVLTKSKLYIRIKYR
jgi:hypothetical protein